MKIGQPSDPTSVTAQTGQSAAAKTATAAPERADRRAPGVGVTESALARRPERTRSGDVPEVDMEKVNAMREAIAQKRFPVNAEAIADKLLANARDMLKRSPS